MHFLVEWIKFSVKKNKTLNKYWKNGQKYWKSQGILSVRKSGNPVNIWNNCLPNNSLLRSKGSCRLIGHERVSIVQQNCQNVTAPISLICMSTHKASADRWLLKPQSHIWAACHLGIAEDPFKKARPKCALHYHDYQLPDHLYISPTITSIKGQC